MTTIEKICLGVCCFGAWLFFVGLITALIVSLFEL